MSEKTTDLKKVDTDETQRIAGVALRKKMDQARLTATASQRFYFLESTLSWAGKNLPDQYQGTVSVIKEKLDELRAWYEKTLADTVEKNIDATALEVPVSKIIERAANHMDQQMSDTMQVAHNYVIAMAQMRDDFYPDIHLIRELLSVVFTRFRDGDPEMRSDSQYQKKLQAIQFGIGDRVLVNLGNAGSSGQNLTMSTGSKEMVPSHLLSVPFEHIPVLPLVLPLYFHELFHALWVDIPGFWKETTKAVFDRISKAMKNGDIVCKTESIKLGDVEVPASEYVRGIYHDITTEFAADVFGILTCGPAFVYSFMSAMPAINAMTFSALEKIEPVQTFSLYRAMPEERYMMDPHPPEYLRIKLQIAALRMLGFEAEARDCSKQLAAANVNSDPKLIWKDAEGTREEMIELLSSDLDQAASFAVEAVLRTPLDCLSGLTLEQIISWTEEQQTQATELAERLNKGQPDDQVDPVILVAAASIAYWNKITSSSFPFSVQEAARIAKSTKMLLSGQEEGSFN